MKLKYSIIIPVFNEEDSLKPLWKQLKPIIATLGSWEVIFINDGSRDSSLKILKELQASEPGIELIHFSQNQGKAAALQAGFHRAQGEIAVTMDADLQDDPKEIPKLIMTLGEEFDLVSGWKKDRKDPWHKTIPSFFFNGLIRLVSGVKLHDINCGFKAYKKDVIKNLTIYGEIYRFIPILAVHNGFRVGELPVKHHPRKFGKSKYGISRFIRGLLDLFTVLFLTKFMKRPLHLFGPIGIFLFAAGFLICLHLSYAHFVWNETIGDRPLLLLGVLFIILGIQLVFTGLLAELVTYYAQSNKIKQKGEDSARINSDLQTEKMVKRSA
jgi:glycosyltransferase involved in cell wall biosynthesis